MREDRKAQHALDFSIKSIRNLQFTKKKRSAVFSYSHKYIFINEFLWTVLLLLLFLTVVSLVSMPWVVKKLMKSRGRLKWHRLF